MSPKIRMIDYYSKYFLSTFSACNAQLCAQQDDCGGRHSFTLTRPTKLLGRCRFDTDPVLRHPKPARDILFHRCIIRRQLRLLCHQSNIHIDQFKVPAPHEAQDGIQHRRAGDSPISRIGVREMHSNIPFRHGAENRVDQSMTYDIRVRVTHQAHAMGNLHAAENEFSPAAKSMNVETMADAKFPSHFFRRPVQIQLSPNDSSTSGHHILLPHHSQRHHHLIRKNNQQRRDQLANRPSGVGLVRRL